MNGRTPVFVYASDPISSAGAKAQLMNQPLIELVGPADLDRARVALVVTEAVDESSEKVVRAIQRDGIARVVLVASRFDEAGVVASVAAGVTAFLRRREATSARLAEVIREADVGGCQLPEGLLRRAAASGQWFERLPHFPDSPDMSQDRQFGPDGLDGLAGVDGLDGIDGLYGLCGIDGHGALAGTTVTGTRLSTREVQVLRLVAEGLDTTDIAEHLAFSESTIKGVLAKVMSRFDARNRSHAIAIAVREGLI